MNYYEIMEDFKRYDNYPQDIVETDLIKYKTTGYYVYHNNSPSKKVAYIGDKKFLGDDEHPVIIEFDICGNIRKLIYKRKGMLHRGGDKPAVIKYDIQNRLEQLIYYRNGHIHRDDEKPAKIQLITLKEYGENGCIENNVHVHYMYQGRYKKLYNPCYETLKYKNGVCTSIPYLYAENGKVKELDELEEYLLRRDAYNRKKKIEFILSKDKKDK